MADLHGGVPSENRYTASSPCPVCGGWERMVRDAGIRCDGFKGSYESGVAFCRREESGETEGSGLFKHRLGPSCDCGSTHSGGDEVTVKRRKRSRDKTRKKRPHGGSKTARARPVVVAEYAYLDEDGHHTFSVQRLDPKSFRQVAVDQSTGRYLAGRGCMSGLELYPYRLPHLLAAIESNKEVYVVEGEADADALAEIGVIATTNPGGAGKWKGSYTRRLKGAPRVVVSGDWG